MYVLSSSTSLQGDTPWVAFSFTAKGLAGQLPPLSQVTLTRLSVFAAVQAQLRKQHIAGQVQIECCAKGGPLLVSNWPSAGTKSSTANDACVWLA
jgi:hypothetical protein